MTSNNQNKILICMGTSGISAGAYQVESNFIRLLKEHAIYDDWKIVRVGDRGLFTDVLVDIITPELGRVTYERIEPDHVTQLVENHILKQQPVEALVAGDDYKAFFASQKRVVLKNCGEIDPENINEYIERGGYDALKKAIAINPVDIVEEIKVSGLRGRGGGGFSTGLKWQFCLQAEGDQKYVVCNADEGDPGAFMDRSILEGDPQAVIEGMVIAGLAIGASEGIIYCRAEYPLAIKILNKAIAQAKENRFLGENILDTSFSFNLYIKEGAGAFVCGEETALLSSIEGLRGMPKPRPPFPAQKGLWGKPTLINNVETFANVRHIIAFGAESFASCGTEKSKGTKVFAVSGKAKNTGLIEIPMGTTIRELILGAGGGLVDKKATLKGVQLGGPSGGCLPESLLDTPIDYESINETGAIMGSGGFVVMDNTSCMVDIAEFFLKFTVAESCGKCTPCRVGLRRMLDVLEEITSGKGTKEHLVFLEEMGDSIKKTALCGLGNTAPNPILTTMRYFKEEYETHINDKKCPSLVCVELIDFEVIENKCVKCGKCFNVCPVGAITWQKKELANINKEKCIKCKACIGACPFGAIR